MIRRNVTASAVGVAALPVRSRWIAPIVDDPHYENLYDRFYGAMSDIAIVEQLGFAAVISGRGELAAAARRWLLGVARAWRPEIGVPPDYGTAYAITRLMKGLAVGWDLLAGTLDAAERRTVRSLVLGLAEAYWDRWYRQPPSAGPGAHTHHAHLEWASLGVTALAMANETAQAKVWLDAAITKFERDLLPFGLAPDGAQIEGASFWPSTMFYRFLFLDPLRRVTGIDLAAAAPDRFSADVSIAAVAGPRRHRQETMHQSVVLEPDYAQLGYHAPSLTALARLHRSAHLQGMGAWDPWLGELHDPGHVLPTGERLRFCVGPYALLWFDPTIPARLDDARRAFHFPSVDEAYLRAGWEPGGLVVAAKSGRLVVHAGGRPVMVDMTPDRVVDRPASVAAGTGIYRWEPADLEMVIGDASQSATGAALHASGGDGSRTVAVQLIGPDRVRIERADGATRSWWAAAGAEFDGRRWEWSGRHGRTTLELVEGSVVGWHPRGFRPERRVGYGELRVTAERDPRRSLTVVEPGRGGRITVEVRASRRI